jgi:hypothetical protein
MLGFYGFCSLEPCQHGLDGTKHIPVDAKCSVEHDACGGVPSKPCWLPLNAPERVKNVGFNGVCAILLV